MSRMTRSEIDGIREAWVRPELTALNEEEQAFARAVAEELSEMVVREEEPGGRRRMRAGRARTRLRGRLLRLDADSRRRVARVSGEVASRRAVAVGAADGRASARDGGGLRLGLDDDSSTGFDDAVRAFVRGRLEAARPRIEGLMHDTIHGRRRPQATRLSRTRVELRLASNEALDRWRGEINFSSVELLDFRWNTEEPGASRGYWELRGPVTPGHEGDLIASGMLPDGLGGEAVGGYFNIPLRDYLPPKPPQQAAVYHVRVLPVGSPRRVATVADGGRVISPVDPSFERPAPDGVGAWSRPAVIRYGQQFESPIPEFTIENTSVYRRARFSLDWFRLVTDQVGSGAEEFHVSGFIIQHSPQGAHVPVRIGPYSFVIGEDDRSRRRFGQQATFFLGTPNVTYWPRTFTAVLSVMEEDDGGSLADWQASIAEMAQEMMLDPASVELASFLGEMQEKIAEMQAEIAAEMAAELAALISALVSTVSKEIISAAIAVVVAWIAAHIRAGAMDDFYGVRVYGMCLTTNDVRRLADGTAGDLFSNAPFASGGRFEGSEQADGSFRLGESELQFKGLGGPLEGSPTSGVLNAGLHWEFFDEVDV